MPSRVAFLICLTLFLAFPAQAQPWDAPSAAPLNADEGRSFTGVGVEAVRLWDETALSFDLRIGRQLPNGISWGNGVHLLVTPVRSGAGDHSRRITALAYVGPGIDYARRLAGPVSGYGGAVFGLGVAGFEEQRGGRRVRSRDVFAGVKPSVGLFLQTGRLPYIEALQMRAGASVFVGRAFSQGRPRGNGRAELAGWWPSVAVSLRVVR